MQNEPKNQNDLLGITQGFIVYNFEFVNASYFAKAPFANTLIIKDFNFLIIPILDIFSEHYLLLIISENR